MTCPVSPPWPTAIFTYFPSTSGSCLDAYPERFRKTASTTCLIATELQVDMHGQVHIHSGMPCKFNHYMHVCLARNYPETLSHCGHGHDLTSVAQLSVINIADIRSAFDKTLASERFVETLLTARHSRGAHQRQASMLVFNILVDKYSTMAFLEKKKKSCDITTYLLLE